MTTNEIKKGMKVKVFLEFVGKEVDGIMMDNKKGNSRIVHVKGSQVGLVDEMGGVYGYNITKVVNDDGTTVDIVHTEQQLKSKEMNHSMGF